jgi:ribonuclease BN (tRNA processing enzyme)
MQLTFLGTCAGTEPMPGRKHTSFVIEHGGKVYWFDAGAGCSYTAHLLGIDLLAVRSIFISHTHMDHIGGLANLLWDIHKLNGRQCDPERRISGKRIDLFIPDLQVWQGMLQVLRGTEGQYNIDFDLEASNYQDGPVFTADDFQVSALHNLHLGTPPQGQAWKSYSFCIEAASKRIVFSGDIKDVSELEPLLDDCDLLLVETGHHRVEDICAYAREKPVKRLGFLHHGRAILADPEGEARKAREIFGDQVLLAEDGMRIDI